MRFLRYALLGICHAAAWPFLPLVRSLDGVGLSAFEELHFSVGPFRRLYISSCVHELAPSHVSYITAEKRDVCMLANDEAFRRTVYRLFDRGKKEAGKSLWGTTPAPV